MNRAFVDTLFVVALINRRDQHHSIAVSVSERYEGYSLVTTDCILLEIGNALSRNFKQQAVDVINEFRDASEIEVVQLNQPLFERGFDLYASHRDKSWGLVDCISFTVMKALGLSGALTFDQHFVQAGFRALMKEENIS